jgi:hypothetical protein
MFIASDVTHIALKEEDVMIKSIVAIVAVVLAVTAVTAYAGAEEDAIRQAALDYCESWYAGDPERMEGCLHPELAKRIVRTDPKSGRSRLDTMGAMRLVQYARKGYGKKTPKDQQQADVEILDVFGNVATVKATMSGWVDYMHLARTDGKWLIVNVLWEMKPDTD